MKRIATLTLIKMALLCFAVALPAGDALAQQKQKISYKIGAENAKYTQQHAIDVGDGIGHEVRVYEIHRTFPSNAPAINGVKQHPLGAGDRQKIAKLLSREKSGLSLQPSRFSSRPDRR